MTIGVFFGSRSPEHDVSIITGELIISGLTDSGHEVVPVYISKDGDWFSDPALGKLSFFQSPSFARDLRKLKPLTLDFRASHDEKKMVFKTGGAFGKKIAIEFAFPAFHGERGEDGAGPAFFELLNIPYVGCDIAASAIAMDKIMTKQIVRAAGLSTADFVGFSSGEWKNSRQKILEDTRKIGYPLFVKPARLGSSIGIAKAKDEKELEFGIEVALHYGERVLIEKGVENLMDITAALIGNDDPQVSLLQESVFGSELFSYEEKYIEGGGAQLGKAANKLEIPARVDEATTKQIQETAKKVYRLIGASGIGRVDFLYDKKEKKFYVSEVNTLPGTLYHHLWDKSGVPLGELLKRLLGYAKEKFEARAKLSTAFQSNILSQGNFTKLKLGKKK